MKPELISFSNISPLACIAVFAVVIVVIGIWSAILHRRHAFTRDHLITAIIGAGILALFLFFIYRAGRLEIKAYGAMLMVGFIVGMISAIRLGKRRGIPAERLLDLGLLILICSVLGARIMYVLITPNAGPFLDLNTLLRDGMGGLSFHGGLIGGILASIIYTAVTKLNYWRVADSCAPAVAVGYAITRIGCFLNGCCYGTHTDLPWATTFPHSPDGLVASVHPTQIYASLMGFAMFGILLLLSRGKSLGRAGRLLMVFFVLEGVERFVMEFFRQPDPSFHGGLTSAQLLSAVIIAVGIIGWFVLPKRPAVDEQIVDAKSAAHAQVK